MRVLQLFLTAFLPSSFMAYEVMISSWCIYLALTTHIHCTIPHTSFIIDAPVGTLVLPVGLGLALIGSVFY